MTSGKTPDLPITAESIAKIIGGRVQGDGSVEITGISGLRGARKGDLSFVAEKRYLKQAAETKASVLLISEKLDFPANTVPALIIVPNVEATLERLAALFVPPQAPRPTGISASATINPAAKLGKDVAVGSHSVVEQDATVGDGTIIGPQVFIGAGASVGRNCQISPGVKILHHCCIGDGVILHPGVIIGGDGFGYYQKNGIHEKIPQLGNVVIEDDVEIGSNTTVDRARFGATRIGRGTKIDNLVMVAHNVQIGENCVVTGQCGIAGSTEIGNYVMIGAQCGIIGHISIGDGAQIAARSGIHRDVPPGALMMGMPAEPRDRASRQLMSVRKLPNLIISVRALRKKLNQLCEAMGIEKTTEDD